MSGKTLTYDQVLIVRDSDVGAEILARNFKVSEEHIKRIQKGTRRACVPPTALERIMRNSAVDPETGCWNWGANTVKRAHIVVDGKGTTAARFAYHHLVGEIPEGKFVCHHCDNMRCVNPDHLFVGTSTDNNRDMHAKGRGIRGENHHWTKLTEENVRAAREMRKRGLTWRELGEHFNVTPQAIYNAASGKTWNWLT